MSDELTLEQQLEVAEKANAELKEANGKLTKNLEDANKKLEEVPGDEELTAKVVELEEAAEKREHYIKSLKGQLKKAKKGGTGKQIQRH